MKTRTDMGLKVTRRRDVYRRPIKFLRVFLPLFVLFLVFVSLFAWVIIRYWIAPSLPVPNLKEFKEELATQFPYFHNMSIGYSYASYDLLCYLKENKTTDEAADLIELIKEYALSDLVISTYKATDLYLKSGDGRVLVIVNFYTRDGRFLYRYDYDLDDDNSGVWTSNP
jgi:hypothetical protein